MPKIQTFRFGDVIIGKSINDTQSVIDHQVLIPMFDSSESMQPHWNEIQKIWNTYIQKCSINIDGFCFSNQIYKIGSAPLATICAYGGSQSNIIKAFQELRSLVENYQDKQITIIFITNGKDSINTNNFQQSFNIFINSIEKVNIELLVLGIGNEFPTWMSTQLRNALHSGRSNTPHLFWANNDLTTVTIAFDNLLKYTSTYTKVIIPELVQKTPISKYDSHVLTDEFFICSQEYDTIIPTKDDITGILYQWLEQLNKVAIEDKDKLQEYAKKTIILAYKIVNKYFELSQFAILLNKIKYFADGNGS